MPVNPDDPQIPVGCVAQPLPDTASDLCTPEFNYGPIRNLYFTRAPFAAVPTAAEIERRLGLFDTDPTDDEAMTGPFVAAVSFGTATRATEEFNGIDYAKPSKRAFKVLTKETSQKNIDLAELTAKGGLRTRAYGVDSGNYWWGGQTGLGHSSGVLVLDAVVPEGFDAAQTIEGTFTTALGFFTGKRMPSPVPVV
jgi:hypothetical protein